MIEIHDIYDIIDVIRVKNHLSVRRLALLAGISPTTLASVLTRKPKSIDKDMLIGISNVFNITWYELINKTECFADQYALNKRINISLSEPDIDTIKQKFIQLPDNVGYQNEKRVIPKVYNHKTTSTDSVLLVMRTLNEDGILEVMKKIVEVASNPKYQQKGN
jgi:transcriptional regulator with XRE-family HTH domain